MIEFGEILRSLFPKGKAFRFFTGSYFKKLSEALAKEPERIGIFYDKVRDSGLPKCGTLPSEALSDWENFLGLPRNDALTDDERCERIEGKYTAQGGQGIGYLQGVLQNSGYPVYGIENIPSDNPSVRAYVSRLGGFSLGGLTLGAYTDRIDPRTVTGLLIAGPPTYTTVRNYRATLGGFSLGGKKMGDYLGTTTTENEVTIPPTPSAFIFIWFLTGENGLGDFVDIPIEKKNDFIKQILQIKPAHTWVIAQVNFV